MGRHLNGKYVSSGEWNVASVEEVSRVQERCKCGSASNGDKLMKYSLTLFSKPVFNYQE